MPNLRRSSGVAALLRGTFSWEGLRSFAKIEILEDRIWVKVTKATAFQCSRSLSEVLTLPFPQPKTFFRLDFCDRLGLGLLLQWCWWHVENCHLKLASYILRPLTHLSSFKNWQSLAKKTVQTRSNEISLADTIHFPTPCCHLFNPKGDPWNSQRNRRMTRNKWVFSFAAPPQNWATGSKAAKPEQIWGDPVVPQQNDANAFVWETQIITFTQAKSKKHTLQQNSAKATRCWQGKGRPQEPEPVSQDHLIEISCNAGLSVDCISPLASWKLGIPSSSKAQTFKVQKNMTHIQERHLAVWRWR